MRPISNWTEAVIASFRDVTPTVRELMIRPASGVAAYPPGSHLQVQVMLRGKPQTRSYSLVGQADAIAVAVADADAGGLCYRIAVKRLPEGRGGSLALWQLAVGDRLLITPPQNHFPLDLAAPAYLLAAGGIGITPMVLMAQTLAARGANVRLLYGARSASEWAFLQQLQQLLPGRVVTAAADAGESLDMAAEIAALPAGGQLYVCGPVPMLEACRRLWAEAKRPLADLRFETFGSSGRLAPQPFRVQIPRHQLDILVPADCSLLDALEMAGVQSLYNCRRGECGLCTMDVLAVNGELDHRDVFLSDEEKQAGKRICVCVSRVVGDITLESAYRPEA